MNGNITATGTVDFNRLRASNGHLSNKTVVGTQQHRSNLFFLLFYKTFMEGKKKNGLLLQIPLSNAYINYTLVNHHLDLMSQTRQLLSASASKNIRQNWHGSYLHAGSSLNEFLSISVPPILSENYMTFISLITISARSPPPDLKSLVYNSSRQKKKKRFA